MNPYVHIDSISHHKINVYVWHMHIMNHMSRDSYIASLKVLSTFILGDLLEVKLPSCSCSNVHTNT